MKLFIDTEFTSLRNSGLLSIGPVAGDERERYVELAARHMAVNAFVQRKVFSHYARGPAAA